MFDNNDEKEEEEEQKEQKKQKNTFIGWFVLLLFVTALAYIVYKDVTAG